MLSPNMINPEQIPDFPTDKKKRNIELPSADDIRIGDFIIARYTSSRWAKSLPWDEWHHAALVSKINPLTIIEAVGSNASGQPHGPTEVTFSESVGFGKAKNILEIKWLQPIFPKPIRAIAAWYIPHRKRNIIGEQEARRRVVQFARDQIGEPYSLITTKWNENRWYCSLLIYKSYSRTITGMYLENYIVTRAGFYVTPRDLLESSRSREYFSWTHKSYLEV